METNESLFMVSFYTVMGTMIFSSFRYELRLNLLSSLILSASVFCLLFSLMQNEVFGAWMSEYIWAVIVLGGFVAIIIVLGKSAKKETCDSDDGTKCQQNKYTIIYRLERI